LPFLIRLTEIDSRLVPGLEIQPKNNNLDARSTEEVEGLGQLRHTLGSVNLKG
jgi:hypothetical protein